MRPNVVLKLALLGLGTGFARLIYGKRRRGPPREEEIPASDPDDPVQSIGETAPLELEDLGVDAQGNESFDENAQDAELDAELEADGRNWREALESSAVENAPLGEITFDDDEADDDDYFSSTRGHELGDQPVADRGSGGAAGI